LHLLCPIGRLFPAPSGAGRLGGLGRGGSGRPSPRPLVECGLHQAPARLLTFSSSTQGTGRWSAAARSSRRNTWRTRPVDWRAGTGGAEEGKHAPGFALALSFGGQAPEPWHTCAELDARPGCRALDVAPRGAPGRRGRAAGRRGTRRCRGTPPPEAPSPGGGGRRGQGGRQSGSLGVGGGRKRARGFERGPRGCSAAPGAARAPHRRQRREGDDVRGQQGAGEGGLEDLGRGGSGGRGRGRAGPRAG
jgi:hypothetical protein